MMPEFLVEEESMEKLVNLAISLFTYWESEPDTRDIVVIVYIWTMLWTMLIFNLIL